jgi:putative mRNA 3-end processing factor
MEPRAITRHSSRMIADFAWIRPEPHGIHVVPADCWIDPSQPVANALITHGHADHARGGHGRTVATPETLAIMELRYQTRAGAMPAQYGETIRLPGGVDAIYVPAGHVLGSAPFTSVSRRKYSATP